MIFRKARYFHLCFSLSLLHLFWACKKEPQINIHSGNFTFGATYSLNYANAYQNGFVIPSEPQDGIYHFEIKFKVNKVAGKQLYYKLFYQNESYKFPEEINGKYNPLSSENFYGTNNLTGFDTISENEKEIIFTAKLLIEGNPRRENRYYGPNTRESFADETEIQKFILQIQSNPQWNESVKEKAAKNNVSLQEQIYHDAQWMASKNVNNKWQRNPRVGKYSALLVAADRNAYDSLPSFIKNISESSDSGFVSPYYYFLHGEGKNTKGIATFLIEDFIHVKAIVPLQKGIYVNYNNEDTTKQYFNQYVNDSEELFRNAVFAPHFSLRKDKIDNIPVITDFLTAGYSQKQYQENKVKYDSNRVKIIFENTKQPGKTFGYDEKRKGIWFKNPGNNDGEFVKENVGVKTRHAFIYGKYTFKIKMTELLTKDNVWTGITNAIWFNNESNEKWNERRICKKEGYMPFYGAGKGEQRVPAISYSEIDFEILKAAEIWPRLSYPDSIERHDPPSHIDKVMIACTNWDMACRQPQKFDIGLRQINYRGSTFNIHRWNEWYNALTLKTPESDDTLFARNYYYFQLEWKPTEIIWRVGPEKNQLRIVGYMNNEVTTIPNNQMLVIITQEYHYSKWWPKAPFNQEDIPFPAKDLEGILYELEIE